jgi:hypothetical protein
MWKRRSISLELADKLPPVPALNVRSGHPCPASGLIYEPIGWPNSRPDNALRKTDCARGIAGAQFQPNTGLKDKGKQADASVNP